jgi:glycosyltransferase involved in cell wall biosynthesis
LHNYRLWCISGILYRDNKGICEDCVKKAFPLSGIKNKCYRGSLPQSILAQLSFAFYRLLSFFSYVDKFFVLTEFQKEKVLSLGLPPSKVILKPNGLTLKDKKPFLSNRSGYVFVGRLEKNKGIHLLLETWKKLPKKYHLTIIGNSPDIKELQEVWQSDNITFKGKCSHEETMQVISGSSYILQTSLLYETFGLTIIEAFACGTPVIGFNIGTRPEFIQDSYNGFLCTPETLLDTIMKAENYPNYAQLQKNALTSYEQYDSKRITQMQIDIYKSILAEP